MKFKQCNFSVKEFLFTQSMSGNLWEEDVSHVSGGAVAGYLLTHSTDHSVSCEGIVCFHHVEDFISVGRM